MEKKEKLPVFKAFIEDEFITKDGMTMPTGVSAVGFVDQPATDMTWMAFNSDHKELSFKVSSKEKRIVSGWAMVADMPIYRNQGGNEFYVQFTKDDIAKIARNFFKYDFNKSVNLMHDGDMFVDGVYVVESVVTDERGILIPEKFGKAPEGSWFLSFAVDNDEVWNDWIKSGAVKGFSVEGLFKHIKIKEESMQELENLHNKLANLKQSLSILTPKA